MADNIEYPLMTFAHRLPFIRKPKLNLKYTIFKVLPAFCRGLPGLLLAFAIPYASGAENLTAEQVIQEVDARYDGDSIVADYTLVLRDRRDRERSRTLTMYSKDFGADTKSLSQFDSPADIRGTSYLNFDWDNENTDDDSWLYLPSLQRVKRLASGDTADSFLGSDFTYADINGYEIAWYDYSFVNESDIIEGQDTWVIDIVPKPEFQDKAEDATGYSRLRTWIRKDNFVQIRAQAWVLRGNRIKYFNAEEIEEIDGIWTVGRLQAVTTRNERLEHASVLQINDVTYNVELDDDMFTPEYMQRGLD